MVPLFVTLAGLAVDGAVLLSGRRQLQSIADGAARAGARRLDVARLRSSDGADVQLDPAAAHAASRAYLNTELARGLAWEAEPEAAIQVGPRRVHVIVQGMLRTPFLRIVNIPSVPVEATADADVRYGIHAGNGT